jgi:DMSO/TMAO reductase YedYZ molybdopterin-dependent catalytic subunit
VHTRRNALAAGGGLLVVGAAAAAGGGVLQRGRIDTNTSRAGIRFPAPAQPAPPLPAGYEFDVKGLAPYITPNSAFYRVDTDLTLPQIPAEQWSLKITGALDRPIELSFDDLLSRPLVERRMTLCCVSNPVGGPYVGTARWLGVSLPQLLRDASVHHGADQVLSRSQDGLTIGTPTELIMDGREALLVVGMNGEPLPVKHGFPARLIVPGLYGYASATKWVRELNLTTFAAKQAYWVQRGYVQVGTARTATRIDVPRQFADVPAGPVTVAGVAWSLHRGISLVQYRIDGGPWHDAELSTEVDSDLWRQWRATWNATAGSHRIEARAADGDGTIQPGSRMGVFPSGATGWPSSSVTVTG